MKPLSEEYLTGIAKESASDYPEPTVMTRLAREVLILRRVRDAARKVDAMYDSLDEHGSQHQRLGPWKELHEALRACEGGESSGESSNE